MSCLSDIICFSAQVIHNSFACFQARQITQDSRDDLQQANIISTGNIHLSLITNTPLKMGSRRGYYCGFARLFVRSS